MILWLFHSSCSCQCSSSWNEGAVPAEQTPLRLWRVIQRLDTVFTVFALQSVSAEKGGLLAELEPAEGGWEVDVVSTVSVSFSAIAVIRTACLTSGWDFDSCEAALPRLPQKLPPPYARCSSVSCNQFCLSWTSGFWLIHIQQDVIIQRQWPFWAICWHWLKHCLSFFLCNCCFPLWLHHFILHVIIKFAEICTGLVVTVLLCAEFLRHSGHRWRWWSQHEHLWCRRPRYEWFSARTAVIFHRVCIDHHFRCCHSLES